MAKKDFNTVLDTNQKAQASLVAESMSTQKGMNIKKHEKPETLSSKHMILIKPSMYERLLKEANRNNVSFNYLVNVILQEAIDKYGL